MNDGRFLRLVSTVVYTALKRRIMRKLSILAANIIVLVVPPCSAQEVRIEAVVVDGVTGEPVVNAVVSINGRPVALTERSGEFVLPSVSSDGTDIQVRRIGYLPASFELVEPLPVLELRIVLDRVPFELDPLTVEAAPSVPLNLRGFEERRRMGFGHFVTAEMLERRPGAKVNDFLRVVPSLYLERNPETNKLEFRSRRVASLGGGCGSRLFIDGLLVEAADTDWLDPTHIAGIEVYRGPSETPMQFGGVGACGAVVVIWTK